MSAAPGKLSICLLASEVAPLSKTGGLADVSGALAKYLHGDGHDVRLFTPCYSSIDRAALGVRPVAALQQVPLSSGAHRYVFSVLEAALPGAGGARCSSSTARRCTSARASTRPTPTSTCASSP